MPKEGKLIELAARRVGKSASMRAWLSNHPPPVLTPEQATIVGTELIRLGSILRMHPERPPIDDDKLILLAAAVNFHNKDIPGTGFLITAWENKTSQSHHVDVQGNTIAISTGPAVINLTIHQG